MSYQIVNFSVGWVQKTKPITREAIMNLQDHMIAALRRAGEVVTPGNTDDKCPLKHHFAPGLYAREIFIPAGILIIGKIHRHSHVNTISQGKCVVATEFGLQEFTAPHTFISQPGVKRAVLALEDTIWTTYHPTEETDLDKIEEYVIAPSFDDFDKMRLT
jgi:hypothetical protein